MPWITSGIIAACVLIQAYVSFIADDGDAVLLHLGYFANGHLGLGMISCAFVHAGWLHLIGNMLFLFLAGSSLEDRWGPVPFLVFYLLGAAAGSLAFSALHHGDPALLVGASGAVAAAMGAFLVCFTRAKIKLAYWFFRSVGTFEMSAYSALPLWLGEQLLMTGLDDGGAVAYTAHIGGFAFGAAVALLVRVLRPRAETETETDADADADADRVSVPRASIPRASARAVPPIRPSVPRIAPDPLRAAPRAPTIVVVAPVTATAAPIVHDPDAEGPRLLR